MSLCFLLLILIIIVFLVRGFMKNHVFLSWVGVDFFFVGKLYISETREFAYDC